MSRNQLLDDISKEHRESLFSQSIQEHEMKTAERPHKSTTHEERFFHFQTPFATTVHAATVFARKEDDGTWYASPAFCSRHDEFNRKIGRTVARRRYFNDKESRLTLPLNENGEIDYEILEKHITSVAYIV